MRSDFWRRPRALFLNWPARLVRGEKADDESWWRALARWNRPQVVQFAVFVLVAWVFGSIGIHLAERGDNEAFDTWSEAFWSVWVIMFSGLEVLPKTAAGRALSVVVLLSGITMVALFTGAVASTLVELRLRRREVSQFEMEGHLVLCNWASRGVEWVREVHNKFIQDKRPVVIIHDQPESIDLPDTADDPAFNDVYIVKGDPTNEIILRRARVARAHSVVVLSDDRQGEHADGKTILTCITLRNLCKGHDVNIAVEARNPANRLHLLKAGADEIISSDELGLRLLARTALYHGMTRVYQELLTVGRDANEMYLVDVPTELIGRDFVETASMFLRYRNDRRSCLLIGIQRDDEMTLNPVGNESGPLQAGDQLILLSRSVLNALQVLPTVPPLNPKPEPD